MAKLIVYRTPTSTGFAEPGRNRWVRAESEYQARELCRQTFGVYPVEVFPAPGNAVTIWETKKR